MAPLAPKRPSRALGPSSTPGQRVVGWLFLVSIALLTYGMTPLTFNLDEIKVSILFCVMPILLWAYFFFYAKGDCPAAPAPLNLLLWLYLAVMLVSTLHMQYRYIGWYMTGFTLACVGCYYGPIGFVRRRDDLERLAFALVLICFGTLVFGYLHRLGFFNFLLDVFYGGQGPRLEPRGNPPYLYSPPMHNLIYTLATASTEMLSTILNRDFFSGYLNMMVPVALGLAIATDSPLVRTICLLTVGFGDLAIFLAMSKNDYVVMVFTPIVFFALYQYFVRYKTIRVPYWWIWVLGVVVTFSTIAFLRWSLFSDKLKLFTPEELGRNLEARYIIWGGSWKMFLHNPILGGGPGSFRIYFARYRHPDFLLNDISTVTLSSHNLFLDYLCETGIVGFVSVVGFLGAVLFYVLRQTVSGDDRRLRALMAGLFCAILAILLDSATSPHTRWAILGSNMWAMLGVGVAGANIARLRRGEEALPRWSSALRQARGRAIAGFGAAALLFACWIPSCVYGVRYFAASVENNKGLVYLNLPPDKGWMERATGFFERAIQLNPTFVTSYYKLASVYHVLSQTDEERAKEWLQKSLDTYERLARLSPDYSEIHFNLGIVYETFAHSASQEAASAPEPEDRLKAEEEERHYLELACAEYDEAARQSSKLSTQRAAALAHQRLSLVSLSLFVDRKQQNDQALYDEARAELQKALEIDERLLKYDPKRPDVKASPKDGGDPGLQMTLKDYGILLERAGRDEDAAEALHRYLLRNPGDKEASDALARALNSAKDRRKVESTLEDLISSNPLRIDYRIYRFTIEMSERRWQDAWGDVQKSLKLVPDEPRSLLAAGQILLRLGRPAEARAYLERLASKPPETRESKQAAQILQSLTSATLQQGPTTLTLPRNAATATLEPKKTSPTLPQSPAK